MVKVSYASPLFIHFSVTPELSSAKTTNLRASRSSHRDAIATGYLPKVQGHGVTSIARILAVQPFSCNWHSNKYTRAVCYGKVQLDILKLYISFFSMLTFFSLQLRSRLKQVEEIECEAERYAMSQVEHG